MILDFFKPKVSKFHNRKIFWFDVETSGTDLKLHGIVQIACLIEVNGIVIDQFESNIRLLPGKTHDPKALEVTGFTMEQIYRDFPDPRSVYKEFRTFLAKHGTAGDKENRFIMAGYNANKFDCDMLANWMLQIDSKYAYWDYFQFKPIDVFSLITCLSYSGLIEVENEKLGTVCKYFDIEIDAHDALSDIKATRELTKKVLLPIYHLLSGVETPLLGLSEMPNDCSEDCNNDCECGTCDTYQKGNL